MKLDRMMGILMLLQQKKQVTAPELASRFEVSRRTIGRDIDALCQAGFPVVTLQGSGGGIRLMEGFSLDSALLKKQELSDILTGLRTLESVRLTEGAGPLLQRLSPETELPEDTRIDLASFYQEDLAEKLALLRTAIRHRHPVSFHYYYEKGETDKVVEPCRVVFQWAGWYLFGYCPERQGFRLYKLRRMWQLKALEGTFLPREIPPQALDFGQNMTDHLLVTARFAPEAKYRLVEEYGPDWFTETADGWLLAQRGFSSEKQAVQWFLSYGDQAQVLSPPEIAEQMKAAAERMLALYEKKETRQAVVRFPVIA